MAHLDLANLGACFLDDAQLAVRSLRRTSAGLLPVRSGHLVACDPLVQPEAAALADHVAPPGNHPVEIIAHQGHPALAVLWLQPRQTLVAAALRWEMARRPTQDLSGLEADELIGYPVGAGNRLLHGHRYATGPAGLDRAHRGCR